MTHRVIQWATGKLGVEAVAGIVSHPDLDLVGAWVHSDEKEGHDVGELSGIGPVGVIATRDKDLLLGMPADCVSYMTARTWTNDPDQALEEITEILRSGKNVVNTSWPMLVNPAGVGGEIYGELQDACLAGGTSFYTAGVEPGYGSLGVALAGLNVARDVQSVHCTEILNQALWNSDDFSLFFGFGRKDTSNIPLLAPGVTTRYHESTLRLLADAIGANIEAIVESHRVIYADRSFDIYVGTIPAGTICGMAYQVIGKFQGEPIVTIEHVIKLRPEDFSEVGFPGDGYRVEIAGEPAIRMEMTFDSKTGNALNAVYISCAMAAVNTIPAVCDAAPGVLTIRDLRPCPSKSVIRS